MKIATNHLMRGASVGLVLVLVVAYAFGKTPSRSRTSYQLERIEVAKPLRISILRGIVMDPNNRPLPGSRVRVFIVSRNALNPREVGDEREIEWTDTNDRGAFRFKKLKPGRYKIVVSKPGFDEMTYSNIILSNRTGNRGWLRIKMKLAT